jgi:hypothetical protein
MKNASGTIKSYPCVGLRRHGNILSRTTGLIRTG